MLSDSPLRAWALHTHPGKKRGCEGRINEELRGQEMYEDDGNKQKKTSKPVL